MWNDYSPHGGLVLVGWVLDWSALLSVRTDYIPMAPNTAILFILSGISLVVEEGLAN